MQEIIEMFKFIEKFISKKIRFFNFIIIYKIFPTNKLSEKFIEKFQHIMDWTNISAYQTLSEKFIEKFQDKVKWRYISRYQKLSEEFIEYFQRRVDWVVISETQILSEKFILKNWNKLNHTYVIKFQKSLTPAFLWWLYRTDQKYDYNLLKNKNDDFLEYSKKIEEEVKIVMIEFV